MLDSKNTNTPKLGDLLAGIFPKNVQKRDFKKAQQHCNYDIKIDGNVTK